jgi:hypothetical protein
VTSYGVVYVGSYDRFLYAFDANGGFLWAFFTNNPIRSSPALGPDSTIYVGSGNHLFAIRPNGMEKWHYTAAAEVQSSPAFSQASDRVCVGDDAGVLHLLRGADMNTDWNAQLGGMIRSSPAIVGENIYIADANGKVWAFGNIPTTAVGPPAGAESVPALRAWPNPACGAVTFEVTRPFAEHSTPGRLDVFDTSGRRVASLPIGGDQRVSWNGCDQAARPVPDGMYIYGIQGSRAAGRIVLLRDREEARR